MKPYAKQFYKSKAWRQCRDAYFICQHGLCERCGDPGLIVHHKEYITPSNINDLDITLNHDNLDLLCQTCLNQEHHGAKQSVVRDDVMFDERGNLIAK
ncbi:HNH endonuclease [Aquibacillus koreensis]|uniref:HNH endonuclease n=1 Tax=Aquibacillus koreensis TaxID=279446 RepID=A0A9X3WMG0_9BACI|nr:HNH endonuclease [Aquibacillus koreensis]MCT2535701.1 HNH endonuclease [Aquibacillus koreensis]MDC3420014.1 HNH endonuclease [Aquibacillus koreensis]